MRHVAAYLLANLGGKEQPEASDLKNILSSVGIDADSARLEALLAELSGKDINTVISEGLSKLASVPSGGAAVASSSGAASGSTAAKVEEKVEEQEESDEDMGFGLFD